MSAAAAPLFFGSLELAEQKRLAELADGSAPATATAAAASSAASSTSVAAAPVTAPGSSAPAAHRETLELSATSREAQERHALTLRSLEAERRARTMYVPTDHEEIKSELRKGGQPITLFGEGPHERRERLRRLLAEREMRGELPPAPVGGVAAGAAGAAPVGLFYTPASDALVAARGELCTHSWAAARARLAAAASVAASPAARGAADAAAARLHGALRRTRPQLSQPADERPLSCVGVSRDGALLATGSWGASVRVWDAQRAELRCVLRGHADRVVAAVWRPDAGGDGSGGGGGGPMLATGSVDGTAMLWRVPPEALAPASAGAAARGMEVEGAGIAPPLSATQLLETGVREVATLRGHTARLAAVAWHPAGALLATSGFDCSWRLWDAASSSELLLQEGHTREVYALAWHPDGGLLASGDMAGVLHVWDVRSGKTVWAVGAHTPRHALALDWSPDGVTLASGGDDNMCGIWDLRMQRRMYTIPAHKGLISRVR